MKKLTFYLSFFLLSLFMGITTNSSGQTTIWSENFSGLSYVDHTGIIGPGAVNSGDYPAGVTKWTLNVDDCTLEDADDYIKTQYGQLRGHDLDGDAIWQSENIDISSYSTITFSLFARELGTLEETDYFDVYYKVDAGAFTLIPNWNGFGSANHTLTNDFNAATITQAINSGNTLVIKVIMNNDESTKYLKLDNVLVKANMEYVSSTTTQNSYNIAAGKTNRQIIGIEVATIGTESPISITQFAINANGSSTPVSTNIENAKIYYTGTDNTFATGTQFGSTYSSPTTTNFDVTGTQQLSTGTNYFWLTFDTKTGATLGELIDAECISIVIDGSTETPTITAPAGSRTLMSPLSGSYTIGAKSNYASFTAAANDLNNLGISSTVSFVVASGTYTEQVSLSAIDGTSANNTIVFQSSTSDPTNVTLQFTPTSSANYVVNFDGSDYISFLDMTIQTTGTSSYGRVFVFSGATESITLKGNNINGINTTSGNSAYAVIYAFSGATNMASNINIENNTITNGSYSIYFSGDSDTNLETQNTFINNVLNNFHNTGINAQYQDAIIINKNTLTGKASNYSAYGIFAEECNNALEITQNKVFLNAAEENIGILLSSCFGTAANQGITANNFVSFQDASITTEGINIEACGYQKIYHNSIYIRASGKNTRGNRTGSHAGIGNNFWWSDPKYGHIEIRNNAAYTEDMPVLTVTQTAVDEAYLGPCNNNDWHTPGSTFGLWGNTSCPDMTAWRTASGLDANSVDVNPSFYSSTSCTVGEQTLRESVVSLSETPYDIDQMPRRTMTTPGAKKWYNVWVGSVSSNWLDPNNWGMGQVPTQNDDVCIDGAATFQPGLTGSVDCRDFFMMAESHLNANNNNLSIYGNADMTDGMVDLPDMIGFAGSWATEFKPGNQRYNNLEITKDDPDKQVLVIGNSDLEKLEVNNLLVQNGKFKSDAYTVVDISGNLSVTSGSTVDVDYFEFTGTANSEITSSNNILQSVVIDKSSNAQATLIDAFIARVFYGKNGIMNANDNVEISEDFTVSETGNYAVVNIAAGKKLTVTGATTINNGGELRLKSNVTGEGHYIPQGTVTITGGGKIIIEHYVTKGKWHLISAPVANATVNSLYFNGNPDVWLKKFHESGNPSDWEYITDLSTPMPFGKGFGHWVDVSTDVTTLFEGDILNENLTLNSGSTPPIAFTDITHGFNLVGNPYSCALDWDIGTWQRTNLEGSVWVWLDAGVGNGSGNYLVRNLAGEGSLTDGIIPMCQGFFVRATTSAPVLTIPKDARVYSAQLYYKDDKKDIAPHIILNVSNNNNQDEVWIGFDKDMTPGFDNGRDVSKLFGSTDVPQLYLTEQEYQLSINILPELTDGEERTVAMGFMANTACTYNITAESLEYLFETDIILEDLQTEILHDLHDNPEYSFAATPQDDVNRFLVHFFYLPTAIDNPDDEENNSGVNIYAYDKAVYIKCDDESAKQTGTVSIYDMYGRLLINKDLESGSLNKINVPVSNGYVVVRVVVGGVISTGKVFVR